MCISDHLCVRLPTFIYQVFPFKREILFLYFLNADYRQDQKSNIVPFHVDATGAKRVEAAEDPVTGDLDSSH